ncbi:MAG TPA: hypothetical protein VIV40_19620 [Kofleriaceae bacterium]
MRMLWIALVIAVGCKGSEKTEQQKKQTGEVTAAGDAAVNAAGSAAVAAGGAGEVAAGPKQLEAAPKPKLLDKPVERRLYSDRIEASSFLWTDWNKFQENYHPNYILDGDPKTAWVEGADSSGKGEWVRIHVSPVEGATKIRLRIQNGYQKSKELYGKNARLKKVEVVALPSNVKQVAELKDAMEWQEIAFEQPAGKLEAVELRAVEVVEGSKYTDLCVSDVELYVTGLNVENPAFEKAKLDSLLAWKKKRIEAAKLLGGAKASELPILSGYRVVAGESVTFTSPNDGKGFPELRGSIDALAKRVTTPAYVDAAKRATAALESKFGGWVKVQVTARAPVELPEVDGLREPEGEELIYGGPDDALLLPVSDDLGALVRSAQLGAFDVKGGNPMDETDCKRGKQAFMRGPRRAEDGPIPRELLFIRCVHEESRDGESKYMVWQLLEFDADGNLVLTAGPEREVQWFEWQKGEKGPTLVGGGRLKSEGDALEKLTAVRSKQ